jgi:tRNA A37 N6-isopentenylltransferase MiaA
MAIKSTYFMHKRIHLQVQTWHSPDGHTFNMIDHCQGVQPQPLSLDEKCKILEETIQRVATNTMGYTKKQANKEWFDEECA